MELKAFRERCEQLLDEGIKPTPTEFAKRGWPCVTVSNNRHYIQDGHPPTAKPGSGTTWVSGQYAAVRREILLARGWTFRPHPNAQSPETNGVWIAP